MAALDMTKGSIKMCIRDRNKIITMALVDVNELKKINDEYGHAEGDRLLVCMVSVMKDSLRKQDMVFRLGSDEFILVFYDELLADSEKRMSEIEERFREAQGREGLFYKVSFSIGLMEIYPADRYTICLLYTSRCV